MRIEKFESIRGMFAMYVIITHIAEVLSVDFLKPVWEFAPIGVMVFFVLSGFVIHLSYQNSSDKTFKNYFFRRFNRIYIPLLITFVVSAIFLYLQNGYVVGFSVKSLIGNLLMTQTIFSQPLFNNGPLWSLAYEWWFYMLYIPIIYMFKNKSSLFVYVAAIAACLVEHFHYASPISRFPIYLMVWWFGVDLANAYIANNRKLNLKDVKFQVLALIIASLIVGGVIRDLTIGFFIGYVWYKSGWRFYDKTVGLFHWFGPISYVLYISHWPLVCQAKYLSFIDMPYLESALYLVTCIAFSYLVERIIYPKLNRFVLKKVFPAKYRKASA